MKVRHHRRRSFCFDCLIDGLRRQAFSRCADCGVRLCRKHNYSGRCDNCFDWYCYDPMQA